jgi:REP element-mobilizing transposase RayT
MAHTYPDAQIHCVFSPRDRCDPFPDALREKISMYLIGIGHNQSLPILGARVTDRYVHLLIAVPCDVTLARAKHILEDEFLTLAAQTPIQFRMAGESPPESTQVWNGQTFHGPSGEYRAKH